MVTFKLSDFEKKLLKPISTTNGTKFEQDTKFNLGVTYAMGLDPGFKFPTEMIDTFKFYFVDDSGDFIKANDANLFNNPSDYPDKVVCELYRGIVRKHNCSVVYFTFTAVHPFDMITPFTSILSTTLGRNFEVMNSNEKNMLLIDYSRSDMDYPENGIVDQWIITNDVYELKAIDVYDTEIADEDESEDEEDETDDTDDEDPDSDESDDADE
jgi:hypothetical protein